MKLTIVSNKEGKIISTFCNFNPNGKNAPTQAWVEQPEGYYMHEVEGPEITGPQSLLEIHEKYLVSSQGSRVESF